MKPLLYIAGALLLSGCQSPRQLYYWGNYEKVLYLTYAKPARATLELQREKLVEDIQKAEGRGLSSPPGLHAQLGYVHYQMGNVHEAVTEFRLEKLLFPESAVFMDRMIARAKGSPAA